MKKSLAIAKKPPKRQRNTTKPRSGTEGHLLSFHLAELRKIWRDDPRVPTVTSRRAWALSRNVKPNLVDSWFLRRRACAKRAGEPISEETYELSLELRVDSIQETKREHSSPARMEPESCTDLPSDDTLAASDAQVDSFGQTGAASDTAYETEYTANGPSPTDCLREALEDRAHIKQETLDDQECDNVMQESRCGLVLSWDDVTDVLHNPSGDLLSMSSFDRLCNQGRGAPSSEFTCALCFSASSEASLHQTYQTALLGQTVDQPFLQPTFARIDVSSDTLMQLSAIPFLFCTPALSYETPLDYHTTACDWAIIEEELAFLATQGEFDFSALDALDIPALDTPYEL